MSAMAERAAVAESSKTSASSACLIPALETPSQRNRSPVLKSVMPALSQRALTARLARHRVGDKHAASHICATADNNGRGCAALAAAAGLGARLALFLLWLRAARLAQRDG